MLKSTYSGSPALFTKDGAFDVLQRLLNEGSGYRNTEHAKWFVSAG
jgi:hypothetical protein